MPFDPVDKQPDFVALEERVLQRWTDRAVPRQSFHPVTPEAPILRCYDGPPTANGRPGVHHVEARVFKDVIPRYFTMKGYRVPRRAGWDCHGIPVELEVERRLNLVNKKQIEELGVAEFNKLCRQLVSHYVDDWRRLTDRVGYWVDMDDPYWTMSTSYIESVWWSIKTIFDRGLLYQDYRVVPYCPRCGTALSDHEAAQGYAQTEDLSICLRLPVLSGPLAAGGSGVEGDPDGASLLVWTTMPWTVIFSSLAVVGEDIRYVLARGGRAGKHLVVLAAARVAAVLGPKAEVIRDVPVEELLGSRYRGPFEFVGPGTVADPKGDPASWRYVVLGDFVTTDQGTGIVSTAPAYGEEDMQVAKENGVVVINGVEPDGHLDARIGRFAGMYVRDANALVVEDLEAADLALYTEMHSHTFPFCWRCETPLIYYAKRCWFIATTRFRDRLLSGNAEVDWRPEHIRDGRYGDWLANNVDWAVSRERYWGTPLPVWRCGECEHTVVVGSLTELGELSDADLSDLDPHRPYVDAVTWACAACTSGSMRRVPEVLDAWYDSGAMPFAQFGYPHLAGSAERFGIMFPADYTAEAIDQTRGWWYSLQAISTLLFDENSYRRAMCLGHIVDSDGRKMSKSLGNVLDPWDVIGTHGADALRWLLLVDGNPWQSRRIGDDSLRQVTRKLLMTVWNTYYFFVTYANLAGWTPEQEAPPLSRRTVMDRYILASLAQVAAEVDAGLGDFDVTRAGKRIISFVEDLSNWYVRRSRDRFWNSDTSTVLAEDARSAFATLYTCLTALAGLLAPFTPYLADELHENLVRSHSADAPDSVHLTAFPTAAASADDQALLSAMSVARRLVTLGRDARTTAGTPVRCPLRRAVITVPADVREQVDIVRDVIAAELNVKEIVLAAAENGHLISYTLKPDFRVLGRLYGNRTQAVASAIRAADPAAAVAQLRSEGALTLTVDGADLSVRPEAVQVLEEPATGWQLSSDGPHSVALDVTLDQELRLEWLARDFIRTVNELRKRSGLEIADRVSLNVDVVEDPHGNIAAMLRTHVEVIRTEVLAATLTEGVPASESAERLPIGDGAVLVELVVSPS